MANLQETLLDIAKAIVDSPDEVKVTVEEDEKSITLTLTVAPDDMGMVIGRHGRIAKAIRTVIKAASAQTGKKVSVMLRSSSSCVTFTSSGESTIALAMSSKVSCKLIILCLLAGRISQRCRSSSAGT